MATGDPGLALLPGVDGGRFGPQVAIAVPSPDRELVASGDVDRDGDVDLVTSARFRPPGTVDVLLNTGAGAFVAAAPVTFDRWTADLLLRDVNRDGRLDLVSTHDERTCVTLGLGDGRFWRPQCWAPTSWPSSTVGTADLDGNGLTDLVGGAPGLSRIHLYLQRR